MDKGLLSLLIWRLEYKVASPSTILSNFHPLPLEGGHSWLRMFPGGI